MSKNAYQLVAEFRLNLLRRDTGARAELLASYQRTFRDIELELREITTKLLAGETPSLLAQRTRLRELQRQVAEAIRNLSAKAASITVRNQQAAVTAAKTEALRLVEAQARRVGNVIEMNTSFSTLPSHAIAQLVGVSHGNPIHEVFESLADDLGTITADRIKHALVRGVALGESPDRVTRRIMREAAAQDGNPARPPVVVRRLQLTVRNETFRAYREATRIVYRQSSVVKRWRWVSRQSPLTCIVCFAMDGKTFSLATPFSTHPGCRCISSPVLDEEEAYFTGPEAFDELEPGVQKSIMGDRAFAAFTAGDIDTLDDFVKVVRSRKWGESRVRRSLEELLGKKEKAA